jgi:release factor glutamine methyltransferase
VLTVIERLRAAGCVYAEDEAALLAEAAAGDAASLEALVRRRVDGHPLEYLVGWAMFAGERFAVTDGVFIPRHRTELLATTARSLIHSGQTVLDLCCGTGALGATATRGIAGVRLVAADVDPAAVACARRNLTGAEVHEGDLFAPLPSDLRGRVDVLLANVPYVPTQQIAFLPEEFRVHERRAALDGGDDGLRVLRRVAAQAPQWLAPGGHLLTEAGDAQLDAAHGILCEAGLAPRTVTDPDGETSIVVGSMSRTIYP